MEKLKPYAFLFLGGILYAQGFPNHTGFIIPITPIIATAILLHYLTQKISLKRRLGYYLFYNTVINLHSFTWITGTLQEFGALPLPVAMIMNSLYALIFNPHYWIFILILHLIDLKRPALRSYYFNSGLFSVLIAFLLTGLEYYLPQQFPVMLGQPWIIFSEHLGLAKVVGLVGFSFFAYLATAELLRFTQKKSASWINGLALLVFFLLNPLTQSEIEKLEQDTFQVRLVQANISNFLKIDSEKGETHSVEAVLNRYEQLSLKPAAEKLDLIVWPETAYPYPIYTDPNNIIASQVPTLFSKIVFEQNTPVLFGGYDHFRDNENGSYYKTEFNAALFINTLGQLERVYHKHILIPFGETLPFGFLNEMISPYIDQMAFFQEGTSKTLFETENNIKFITTICYEILRPEFLREYLNQTSKSPNVMINLTNDSWYGNTLEPELHLFLARWRSAEFFLPTLRSTNTGVSVYIDEFGSEIKRLGYEKTGNLDISVRFFPQLAIKTIFQQYGILVIFAICMILFIFHALLIKWKHVKNS